MSKVLTQQEVMEVAEALKSSVGSTKWSMVINDLFASHEALRAERDRLRALIQAVADAEKTAREYGRNHHLSFVTGELERAAGTCFEEAKRWKK